MLEWPPFLPKRLEHIKLAKKHLHSAVRCAGEQGTPGERVSAAFTVGGDFLFHAITWACRRYGVKYVIHLANMFFLGKNDYIALISLWHDMRETGGGGGGGGE